MKRTTLVIAIIAAMCAALFQTAQPAEAQSGRQVWALYMGFWAGGPSWDAQASVLSDHPLIGNYDSRDPGVAGTQIGQAQSAGIDAFIVSWYGLGDQITTTPVLNNLLDRAAERGFHVAAAVDIFSASFNRDRDGLVNSLNYLVNDRANHPGYLRYNGRPVIFFLFQDRAGFSAAEWQSIRGQVDPNHNTLWIAEGISGCCLYGGAMDGMYAFNIAWANGSAARYQSEKAAVGSRLYIPTVHPGWNEDLVAARDGRPNPTSPRDRAGGQFLATSFNGAVSAGTDVILIGSWNEFVENSHIEPSQLYGNQSLDTLRPLIAAWKAGGAVPAAAAPAGASTGQMAQPTDRLNVRSGPGTGYGILGVIVPGSAYPVTGSQSGWYSINFNGQTGWVFGQYVTLTGSGAAPAPASAPAAASGGQSLQATTSLNVRSGPGTGYSILGGIAPGTSYPVTGSQDGWYSLVYNGQTGWVSGQYVTLAGGGAAPAAAAPAGASTGQMAQPTDRLNVRSGPGTGYNILGVIVPGSAYPVTGSQSGWYSINFNGQTGWVSAQWVTVASSTPTPWINFSAASTSLTAGSCTTISWDVGYIQAVYFNGQGVVGQESRQVCPTSTTTYTLDVTMNDGSNTHREITITVH